MKNLALVVLAALLGLLAVVGSLTHNASTAHASSPAFPLAAPPTTVEVVLAPSAPGGGVSVDLGTLSFADAKAALDGLPNGTTIEVPFPSVPGLSDLTISSASVSFDEIGNSITLIGTSPLLGSSTVDVMLTAIWGSDAIPRLVAGVRIAGFKLADIGLSGPVSDFVFPEVAFPGSGSFTLDLQGGVNFSAGLSLSALPTVFLDAIGANPSDELLIEGSVGADFGLLSGEPSVDLTGLSLKVTLQAWRPLAYLPG